MFQSNRIQPKEQSTRLLPLIHTAAMAAREQNPAQQALPASLGFLLGTFPSGQMRRHQQSWHTQTIATTPVQVWSWKPHGGQGISASSGVQLKTSKNSCGGDVACHNLRAFVLRPTSRPGRQTSLGISPLNQKIHFSIVRKSPFCHSTPLKQFMRKLMAKSTRANKVNKALCLWNEALRDSLGSPTALSASAGSRTEDARLTHILEPWLSWSAHWRQALLSPGPAEVQIRISTAALGPWEPGKEGVYFLLVIQEDTAFHCVLLSLMREGTMRKLLLS